MPGLKTCKVLWPQALYVFFKHRLLNDCTSHYLPDSLPMKSHAVLRTAEQAITVPGHSMKSWKNYASALRYQGTHVERQALLRRKKNIAYFNKRGWIWRRWTRPYLHNVFRLTGGVGKLIQIYFSISFSLRNPTHSFQIEDWKANVTKVGLIIAASIDFVRALCDE